MRDMIPIQIWWFILDLHTRSLLLKDPEGPLAPEVAARIHDTGGVLYEAHFFTGAGSPGYELLPEDVTWIRAL